MNALEKWTTPNEELVTIPGEPGTYVVTFFGPHDVGRVSRIYADGTRIPMAYSVAQWATEKAFAQRNERVAREKGAGV
jgi:hypothetical protein